MVPNQCFCHLCGLLLPPTLVFLTAALYRSKTALWSLFFFFCFASAMLSGCGAVPQHHLLQPPVWKHRRNFGGSAPSGASGWNPRRDPQDASWLRHPGWRARPQAVRCAALSRLLFKYHSHSRAEWSSGVFVSLGGIICLKPRKFSNSPNNPLILMCMYRHTFLKFLRMLMLLKTPNP